MPVSSPDQLGLAYVETRSGEPVEGTLRRSVEVASGKYALVENSREFTLVPWRPVLERHIGKQVSGVMRGDGLLDYRAAEGAGDFVGNWYSQLSLS